MENENDKIMERSMQDKMDKMHLISFEIIDVINENSMTDDELDMLYDILDGVIEKFIMDSMTGHCSLQDMLDNSPEKLESIIDTDIMELIKINEKYNLKININDIDNRIAMML